MAGICLSFNTAPPEPKIKPIGTAIDAQNKLRDLCVWDTSIEGLTIVLWGPAWESQDRAARQGLLEVFAGAEAIITGKQNRIEFYHGDTMVGLATKDLGVRLIA